MLACWFVRHFRLREGARELRRLGEAPAIPVSGMVIDFDEPDTPTLAVSRVTMRVRPGGFTPGIWPTAIMVFLTPEPASALPAAERAGWKPIE